jgi:hypothetical protein
MSLRVRTLLTIGLVTAALTAILGLLFSQTLLRAFAEAEVRDTERDVHHARMFLADELRAMDVLNHDWASWDDTYAFIEDANPAYIRANLTDATFQNTHLNLMLFVHTSGRVVWAGAYDLEANREAPVPQGVYDALGLLARPPEEGTRGLLLLPEGVLLVTARPILTSEDQGPGARRGGLRPLPELRPSGPDERPSGPLRHCPPGRPPPGLVRRPARGLPLPLPGGAGSGPPPGRCPHRRVRADDRPLRPPRR